MLCEPDFAVVAVVPNALCFSCEGHSRFSLELHQDLLLQDQRVHREDLPLVRCKRVLCAVPLTSELSLHRVERVVRPIVSLDT